MKQKILSIIIPMYNSKAFIGKCLDSLIVSTQLQDVLDVIVVNDGSTDGCEQIARSYEQRYPNMIRLVNKENAGHGSVVNCGIALCQGTYFKVLDADDWVDTERLEMLLRTLPKIELCDVVVCHYCTFHDQTKKKELCCAQMEHPIEYLSMEQLMDRWMEVRYVFSLHGMIYRCEFYRSANRKLPEKVYYDDGYFITVAASCAERICMIDLCVGVYRIGDPNQSISKANRIARLSQEETVLREILQTHDDARSAAGMAYWYFKVCSILTDYFITAYLRDEDRRRGRAQAQKFWQEVRAAYPDVAKRMRKRYGILLMMNVFHMSEKALERVIGVQDK